MMDDIAQNLVEPTSLRVARYAPLAFRTSLIPVPKFCCSCLGATECKQVFEAPTQMIVVIGRAIVGKVPEEVPGLHVALPICDACWQGYQRRKHRRWWVSLALFILLIAGQIWCGYELSESGNLEPYLIYEKYIVPPSLPLVWLMIFTVLLFNFINGVAERRWFAAPAILGTRTLRQNFTIQFRNPFFIPIFLAAQKSTKNDAESLLNLGNQTDATPPSMPTGQRIWYCCSQGERVGPFTFEQLRNMIKLGSLKESDQVCTHTVPEWLPVRNVPGLVG